MYPATGFIRLSGPVFGILVSSGLLLLHVALLLPVPNPYAPSDPATVNYRTTVRVFAIAAAGLLDIVVGALTAIAWQVTMMPSERSEGIRRGLLTFAATLFIGWLLLSLIIFGTLRYP